MRSAWLAAALLTVTYGCAEDAAPVVDPPEQAPDAVSKAAPSSAPAVDAPEPVEAAPVITISAVGDCTLGGQYAARGAPGSFFHEMTLHPGDYAWPFSGVVDVLSKDDLTIANLEGTLTDEPAFANKVLAFQGPPDYVQILKEGSVEIVNLANNHSADCGVAGFDETVRTLKSAGVGYFGESLIDRRTIRGIEVVNLGFGGGALRVKSRVERAIRAEKKPENLVIVSFHWGIEEYTATNTVQMQLGRAAVDAGADLVLGHHPHRLQGIETYHGARIVYSLGNFVFGGHSNPDDYDSMIYQASFTLKDGQITPAGEVLVPVSISSTKTRNDFRPKLLTGADKDRVLSRIETYSKALE